MGLFEFAGEPWTKSVEQNVDYHMCADDTSAGSDSGHESHQSTSSISSHDKSDESASRLSPEGWLQHGLEKKHGVEKPISTLRASAKEFVPSAAPVPEAAPAAPTVSKTKPARIKEFVPSAAPV